MKTTTQILVLVSTVVLGSLIGILSKFLTLSEEVVPISLQEPLIRHSRSDAFLVRQPTHEMHNHNYKGFARWFKEFDKKKIMPLFRREDHDFSMYYGNPEEHCQQPHVRIRSAVKTQLWLSTVAARTGPAEFP